MSDFSELLATAKARSDAGWRTMDGMSIKILLEILAENESLRKDAERFRWLNRQRSQVWRMLAEMPMNHTAPYIDAAISSPENT